MNSLILGVSMLAVIQPAAWETLRNEKSDPNRKGKVMNE